MSSETNLLPRQSVDAGGATSATGSNKVHGAASEQPGGISASPSYKLQSGGLEVFSFPRPLTDLVAAPPTLSSVTLSWTAPGVDGHLGALEPGSSYYVRVASYTVPDTFSLGFANVVISTSGVAPGQAVSTTGVSGLIPNTTWFVQLWTSDPRGGASFASDRATFTTLAIPPTYLGSEALTFLEVHYTSATVAWGARPSSPPEASSETAQGYVLEASSTNFGALAPGGVVSSTTTFDARVSTLTVLEPALIVDRMYYFRVGSRNHAGGLNYTVLGSTRTKLQANPPGLSDPTYLTVTSHSITAQWDRNGNSSLAYYRLEASPNDDFTVFKSSVETYNLYATTDTLAANTTYFFQVRATTNASTSDWTSLGSTVTLTPMPAAAVSTFTAVHLTSMTVAWERNGNPAGVSTYTVVLTTSPAPPQGDAADVVLSTGPAGAFPYATPTGLTPNTTYFLYVDARNWLGASSGWVALGSTVTRPADPASAAPFVLETAYSSMTIAWASGGNAVDVTSYTVVFTTGASYPNALPGNVELTTAPAGATLAATGTGLVLNATYYAFVRAVGHGGLFTEYALIGSTATRGVAPLEASPPFMALSHSSYKVFWSSGTEEPGFNWEGTTYYVQAARDGSFSPVVAQVQQIGGTDLDLTGLTANTTYHVRVAAFNVFSGTWTSFAVYPATSTLAQEPAGVATPLVHKTSMTVTWGEAGNPLFKTTYTVVASPESAYPNSNPLNALVVSYPSLLTGMRVLTGLNPNVTYYAYVGARNHQGVDSAYSVAAASSTKAFEPDTPYVSTFSMTSVAVSWTDVDAAGYELKASSTNFGALLPGGVLYFSSTTNGNAASLSAAGLEPNTTYYLHAAAYNHADHPSRVELSSAATLALPVANAMFKLVHETSATLTWWEFPSGPSSATSGGYRVDAATADAFGYSDFGGELISSITYIVGLSTLTVESLTPGATYAFRVGSLNWAGAPNFAVAGSTRLRVTPFTWVGGGGNSNWYNAGNWSPRGVPSAGSPVTIAIDVSVVVNASSPSISFSSLTLGSPSGAARANLFLSTAIMTGGDVLIHPGAGLTVDSTQTLRIDGDWTMLGGSSMTHTANNATLLKTIDISATGTFDLRANATIDVTTRGYAGGANNGGAGQGPGGGAGSSANSAGGGGGGHGGTGGAAGANAGGGGYDAAIDPAEPGSGGAGGDFASGTNVGGAGGGYVRIRAGTLKLDGRIRADAGAGGVGDGGSTARAAGGGGSGGGVALYAGEFSGAGVVEADGGTGGTDANNGDDPGGGGAGGIVAIDISGGGNVCSLTVTVAGAASGGGTSGAGGDGVYSSTRTIGRPELTATYVGSDTIKWEWTAGLGATAYRLYASTGGAGNSPSLATSVLEYYERGLMPNTTYQRYLEASACGTSTNTVVQAYSTLASTASALAQTFLEVGEAYVKAAWAGFPSSPQEATSEGYVLEAATGEGFLSVVSSSTFNAAASTLTVSGLERNTTYYFRVASLNWSGAKSSYTALGAVSTLALPPAAIAGSFLSVHFDSATLRWHRFYDSDPLALKAEGFVLEASTTNFGALSPGGEVLSSATANVALSTLAVAGLDLSSTYYFRVGSLNHGSAANYSELDRLNLQLEPSILTLNLGTLDPGVDQSTVSTTVFYVRNAGNVPATFNVWGSTTQGSWTLGTAPDYETPVLQGLFNSVQPPHASFDDPITASTSTAQAGVYDGDQTGVAVPAGESRIIWFRLRLPTSTTTGTQRLRVDLRPTYP